MVSNPATNREDRRDISSIQISTFGPEIGTISPIDLPREVFYLSSRGVRIHVMEPFPLVGYLLMDVGSTGLHPTAGHSTHVGWRIEVKVTEVWMVSILLRDGMVSIPIIW